MNSQDDFSKEPPKQITDFGRCFRAVCQELGITSLRSIAVASGIPQATLWTWANDGKRPRNLAVLELLLDGFRKYDGWKEGPWARDLTNFASHVTTEQYRQALADLAQLEQEVERKRTRRNVQE